jgi:hypothetical protein
LSVGRRTAARTGAAIHRGLFLLDQINPRQFLDAVVIRDPVDVRLLDDGVGAERMRDQMTTSASLPTSSEPTSGRFATASPDSA